MIKFYKGELVQVKSSGHIFIFENYALIHDGRDCLITFLDRTVSGYSFSSYLIPYRRRFVLFEKCNFEPSFSYYKHGSVNTKYFDL